MTGNETPDDRERIHDEMGEHGDRRTTHPRLVCSACDSFVYLTHPREFASDAVRAECNCQFGDPVRGDIPLDWVPIDDYVTDDGE